MSLLNLPAYVLDQRWVLSLHIEAQFLQVFLHLYQSQLGKLVSVLDMPLDHLICPLGEVALQNIELLIGKDLPE